jgi:putative Holliday junction resolvase
MRLLGIDYGAKRVGIALSDEGGTLAFAKAVFKSGKTLVPEIKDYCAREGVTEIVLGDSKNYAGEDNPIMAKILPFKEELEEETGLPVHMESELMTSTAAARFQGKNDMHDASAAALILQSFLDTRNNKN